MVEGDPLFTLG